MNLHADGGPTKGSLYELKKINDCLGVSLQNFIFTFQKFTAYILWILNKPPIDYQYVLLFDSTFYHVYPQPINLHPDI